MCDKRRNEKVQVHIIPHGRGNDGPVGSSYMQATDKISRDLMALVDCQKIG